MKKESSTITIRLPLMEKQAFDRLCESLDITASQILRRCIRETLEAAQSNYPDLLGDTRTPPTKKKGR